MNQRSCCDSESHTNCSGDHRCDSYFIYCSRPLLDSSVEQATSIGCQFGENIIISTVNVNDEPVNFSRSIVLGLKNPFQLQGPSGAYHEV